MAIYRCAECKQMKDDDRVLAECAEKYKDTYELVCPDCAEKLEDDD